MRPKWLLNFDNKRREVLPRTKYYIPHSWTATGNRQWLETHQRQHRTHCCQPARKNQACGGRTRVWHDQHHHETSHLIQTWHSEKETHKDEMGRMWSWKARMFTLLNWIGQRQRHTFPPSLKASWISSPNGRVRSKSGIGTFFKPWWTRQLSIGMQQWLPATQTCPARHSRLTESPTRRFHYFGWVVMVGFHCTLRQNDTACYTTHV